ncbi:methionyl-tRNA formyltransferase [Candidatus Roizmanbacteria bacterium]|nr:methionyl-tRNA formyltransferase [Candidatus Roizmanbacteria bacterium]
MNYETNIIFFGSSNYVIPIIETLNKNFKLFLTVTTEKSPTDSVIYYCHKNNIGYVSASSLSDSNLKSLILNHKSSIGVLADFGLLIPEKILNAFPKGILNIHPSLLPKYRGPTPVQTAILNGDKTTGISFIKLDNEIDHGGTLFQEKEEILPQDSAQSLYSRLFKIGAKMLPEVINKYLDGSLKPKAQNHEKATYTKHLTRRDGYIDIASPPNPEDLDKMIRGYYPWPGAWTEFKVQSSKFKVIKFLPENKIQVEGKKPVSYKDFVNGYSEKGKEILEKIGIKY